MLKIFITKGLIGQLLLLSVLGIIDFSWGVAAVLARESTYRISIGERSKKEGVGSDRVAVLRFGKSPGRDSAAADILKEFENETVGIRTGHVIETGKTKKRDFVVGPGWFLETEAEGNWIRYRDEDYADSPDNTPLVGGARPADEDLKEIALGFVQSRLRNVIKLSKGETLEPWFIAYEINTTGNGYQKPIHKMVASKIVFTRVIDGLPVIGNGSKIGIYIATDNTIVGFDVDWTPIERTDQTRQTVGLDLIRERADIVRDYKMVHTENEIETRLECGYLDGGAKYASEGKEIQVTCIAKYEPLTGVITQDQRLDFIPAVKKVIEDSIFTETSLFAK